MTTLGTLALLVSGFGGAKTGGCDTCVPPRLTTAYPAAPDINANRPCPPMGPPASVLPMKLVVPDGVRITALPGSGGSKSFTGNALFGLRPGYVYRFSLHAPGDVVLYPEVEVRGTLVLRPSMTLMEHYAAINFSTRDLERAAAGALITKVIYLEDPEKAIPTQSTADKPIELPEDNEAEAIKAALANGRLVAIVRLGNRKPTPDELQKLAVPGTVLLPGEQYLTAPASPPTIGWQGVPLFDPILGPKFPHEECFTDGGDKGPRLGVRDDGRLGGLNTTDTAAEYKVGDKNKVTTSNIVCICAPRFVVRRSEMGAIGVQVAQKPEANTVRTPPAVLILSERPRVMIARQKPLGILALIHPQIQRGTQRLDIVQSAVGVRAIFQVEGVKQVTAIIAPEEVQNADDFLLTKDVEPKANVKIGDTVTFTLRYTNRTGKPVTDLVLSDSLSGRLDYIPGTAKSDRPMNVTASPNEAGSSALRFELPGTLQPGQGGLIRFQARVR